MSFSLRWGNSCGTPFDKNKFCNEHREWAYLRPYLEDRPQQQWTTFTIMQQNSRSKSAKIRVKKNKTEKKMK
jgi:hypothetical protein